MLSKVSAACAFGLIALCAPAHAVVKVDQIVSADYVITYGALTSNSVYAGSFYREQPAIPGYPSSITSTAGGFTWSAGFPGSQVSDQPIIYNGDPSLKLNSIIFGISQLGDTDDIPSTVDDFDISGLHLTLGVSREFAQSLYGREFQDLFGDFGTAEDVLIREVLRTSGYLNGPDGGFTYDEEGTPVTGPTSNLLFDFGAYLGARGGSFGEGPFDFVTFSAGKQTGVGTATFVPNALPSVPEPASWAMFIAGFGLMGGALRRRRVSVRFG